MASVLSIPQDPREAVTFPQMIRSAAAAFGDETFGRLETEDGNGESLTYREMERASAELARGLLARPQKSEGVASGFSPRPTPAFAA